MYPQPMKDPDAPKRKTPAFHRDEAERYANQAREAVDNPSEPDWPYSSWCQMQALIHALLGQK